MANRYWVGGTGTWDASTTTHWSATSGGVGGATVPTSADDVIFDSLSNATAYTVTLSGTLNCNNFTMGAPLAGKVTWSGNALFSIYGNLNLSGGTTGITSSYAGNIDFKGSSGTKTIQSNSVSFNNSTIYISGAATFQLLDNWTIAKITKTAGTFDPNGQTVYLRNSSTGGDSPLFGALTFYNLTITFTAASSNSGFYLNSNITVTNNLTITGYSANKRPMIRSNVKGTQRTITCTGASVNYSNIIFEDINILNGTLGTNSIVGDGGGNSGITFTSSTDQHFTNVNGAPDSSDWENAANWTSRVPLPQDNLFFDCAFGTAKTINATPRYIGHNLDFTGATWTTSLTFITGNSSWISGSLTLIAGLTVTLSYGLYFYGRGSHTIDTKGVELNAPFNDGVKIDAITGSYTLSGDYNTRAAEIFNIISGTFDTSTFSLSVGNLKSSSGSNLYLGSGVHSIIGTGTETCSINGNLFAQSSTLKFTNTSNTAITFVGNGKTYNNIWWSRGGSTAINTISGSNTFNDFKDDGTAAHTIKFTNFTNTTVNTFSVNGSSGKEITIRNTSSTTRATLTKSGGGIISGSDWINIDYITGSQQFVWALGANSTIGANTTYLYTVLDVPTVTTQAVSDITKITATGNGNVTADGGVPITERGTVISTSANPTTSDHKDTAAGTTGAFTTSITGLTAGITYHVRAYAINNLGTSYGDDVTFTTPVGISGQVTLSGSGVSGAIVRCIRQSTDLEVDKQTTDGSGNYIFANLVNGASYHICVEYTDGTSTKYNAKSLWDIIPV